MAEVTYYIALPIGAALFTAHPQKLASALATILAAEIAGGRVASTAKSNCADVTFFAG